MDQCELKETQNSIKNTILNSTLSSNSYSFQGCNLNNTTS